MKLKDFDKLDYYLKRHLETLEYLMDDMSRMEPDAQTINTIIYLISLSCAEISKYQQKLEIYVIARYKKKTLKQRKKNWDFSPNIIEES